MGGYPWIRIHRNDVWHFEAECERLLYLLIHLRLVLARDPSLSLECAVWKPHEAIGDERIESLDVEMRKEDVSRSSRENHDG